MGHQRADGGTATSTCGATPCRCGAWFVVHSGLDSFLMGSDVQAVTLRDLMQMLVARAT